MTQGGRVGTALADTDLKKEPFFADTGICFLAAAIDSLVIAIDSREHHTVLARSHPVSLTRLCLLLERAAPNTRREWWRRIFKLHRYNLADRSNVYKTCNLADHRKTHI